MMSAVFESLTSYERTNCRWDIDRGFLELGSRKTHNSSICGQIIVDTHNTETVTG